MRRRQRYTVHRRLLLTFLLLGCAGSFVLGQEMARAFAALPVYAAQSLTFSGAGIAASLVTPIQATGSIGQPTPQPKVVKHTNKPTTKPKSKGPTTKPVTAPVTSPPVVLQGVPVAGPPTTSPCASASCLPGAKPEPPVVPSPSVAPTGTVGSGASSDSVGVPTAQCTPLGLVTRPATTSPATTALGADPASCSSDTATDGASSTEPPTTVSSGVIEAPSGIGAPQITPPALVVQPVVPVVVPAVATPLTLMPAPTETSIVPAAAGDRTTSVLGATAAAQAEQESQG